jgi:hypothetical protein
MKLLTQNGHRAMGLDPRASATTQIVDDLSDRSSLKALLSRERVTHMPAVCQVRW